MAYALGLALTALVVAALTVVWRAPFRALGVLVAGMTIHNFVVMLLLAMSAPLVEVRALQVWKEIVIAFVGGLLVLSAVRAWRAGVRPRDLRDRLVLSDSVVAAFAALLVLFLVVPVGTGLSGRAYAFRALVLIPVLYLYGRVFRPSVADLRWTLGVVLGSAGAVVVAGLVELWFVPTAAWVSMGVNLLSAYNGEVFHGPGGLPENFVQATSVQGAFLRRMVSTYVSPLGLAYVGVLVVPVAVALWMDRESDRRWRALGWASVVLVTAGVLFSVTRLAVALLVPEFALLAYLLRGRRTFVAVPVVLVAAVFSLFLYVSVGPTIRQDLSPIREPAGYALLPHDATAGPAPAAAVRAPAPRAVTPTPQRSPGRPPATPRRPTPTPVPTPTPESGATRIVGFSGDTSFEGHVQALEADVSLLAHHPLGLGLGTYAPRFSRTEGLGESAVLGIFDQLGILAGLLYLALYGLLVVNGWRALRAATGWETRALPLVALVGGLALAPITVTSDVWAGLVVAFLPWWAAGYCATVVAGSGSDAA